MATETVPDLAFRSRAVDVFRGASLVWLVVLVLTPTTGWGGHAEWFGWRPDDVFFPAFLLISGVGLAYQTRNRFPWARLVRRFLILVLLGVALNAWLGDGADLSTVRFPGVLQRIAVVGLVGAGIVALLRRSWRLIALAAVLLTIAWGGLLAHSSSSCAGGEATPDGCGTFLWLDEKAFGADHLYHGGVLGHDPEGIASTLGAVATFLAGFAAGGLACELRSRPLTARAGALVAMAAGWLALTPVALVFAPFGKRLWTPAFVTLNAAGGLALLAVLMLALDTRFREATARATSNAVAFPFEAVGRNTLVLYIGITIAEHALDFTSTAEAALAGSAWLGVAMAMHAANWHVRL